MELAQDRVQWLALVLAVSVGKKSLYLQIPYISSNKNKFINKQIL
jgi:hypothetical protein